MRIKAIVFGDEPPPRHTRQSERCRALRRSWFGALQTGHRLIVDGEGTYVADVADFGSALRLGCAAGRSVHLISETGTAVCSQRASFGHDGGYLGPRGVR